jgi:hypothetical protein
VLIAGFVLLDVVVTLAAIRFVLARRSGAAGAVGGLRQLAALSGDIDRQTQEYLAANWSGDPGSLPAAVGPLLAKLESDLRARGVNVDRALLKTFVEQVILRRGLARANDLREAMKQVA